MVMDMRSLQDFYVSNFIFQLVLNNTFYSITYLQILTILYPADSDSWLHFASVLSSPATMIIRSYAVVWGYE